MRNSIRDNFCFPRLVSTASLTAQLRASTPFPLLLTGCCRRAGYVQLCTCGSKSRIKTGGEWLAMLKSISLVVSVTLTLSSAAMAQQYGQQLCQNGNEIRPNGACVRDATGQCVPC